MEKLIVALEEIFAPLMNLLRYSREYRDVLFPEWISNSSAENSALAEFRPDASTIKRFGSATNVQASETTEQSSITSTRDSEFILIRDSKSHSGRVLSSESMSIRARAKSRFILSWMPSFRVFSCLESVREEPILHLLKTALRLSRFMPKTSGFSTLNSVNSSAGSLK